MSNYVFGDVSDYKAGHQFSSRREISRLGIHTPPMHGIAGNQAEGACSIVLSGGYKDDQDFGDVLLYTGHGGRDSTSGKQIADQSFQSSGNAALVTSCLKALPVRVTKKISDKPILYEYSGNFKVTRYWTEQGEDGWVICRFRLERLGNPDLNASSEADYSTAEREPPSGNQVPARRQTLADRIVRSSRVSDWVKNLYEDSCQICSITLPVIGGRVAEGAHIRPLGAPHFGVDEVSNLLCLCPNHHKLLDRGGIWISEDFEVFDLESKPICALNIDPSHPLDGSNLAYQRALWNVQGRAD